MLHPVSRLHSTLIALGLFVALLSPAAGQDPDSPCVVANGYDLFATLRETTFMGAMFKGVNQGPFAFASGTTSTGNADTIVVRRETASVAEGPAGCAATPADPIAIEMVALHLESVGIVDLGQGPDRYHITLQSEPASTGEMTLSFVADGSGGTFDSHIDVAFDFWKGDPATPGNQPILSDVLRLESTATAWDRTSDGALEIQDVNHRLHPAMTTAWDFWPVSTVEERHPTGARHVAQSAWEKSVPAVGTWGLVALGLLLLGVLGFAVRKLA